MFHTVVLEEEVLPQLLLGIRDCHDHLVAESLRALAELVPILGASKVIGKKQRKVFADGTPGQVNQFYPVWFNAMFFKFFKNQGSLSSPKISVMLVPAIFFTHKFHGRVGIKASTYEFLEQC